MLRTCMVLAILAALMFASVPFAAAEWQENMVTNNTLEDVYVIKSTWQAANARKDIPAGFWTRGSYHIPPGKSKVFYSWDTNSVYLRISNTENAIKANSGTTAFAFWAHPDRSFRVVSQTIDASVTTDQLLYSDRPSDQLVQMEGFVSYTSGSDVVVTPGWVLLNGQPTAPPTDELGNDGGPPGENDGGPPGEDVAPPAWVENVVRNEREENIYVVFTTWKVEKPEKGYPEGFRTRGSYRIRPGRGIVFHSWADNEAYFHISNAAGALKPDSNSGTFEFWVHPNKSFRVVSGELHNGVTKSQLLYSNRSKEELEHSDGFLVYETGDSGAEVTVTSDWVSVSTEPPPPPPPPTVPAGMVLIPAGTFQMGGDGFESPVHAVTLNAFYMDKYEVTNTEYAAFLNAKGKHADAGNTWIYLSGRNNKVKIRLAGGRYTPVTAYANHPVAHVTWYGAMAYAEWAGKRLPTGAEWEYAARGGLVGQAFPWGNDGNNPEAHANMRYGFKYDSMPVGSYAANGYGLYDMAGNHQEWCLDTYTAYSSGAKTNPLRGATSIQALLAGYKTATGTREVRGGHWDSDVLSVKVYARRGNTGNNSVTGFRCVKPVSSAPVNNNDNDDESQAGSSDQTPVVTPVVTPVKKTPTPVVTPTLPPGMALIPSGTFKMGSTTGDGDERPVHNVTLDAFYMDVNEVTNTQFAAFLTAKGKHIDAGKTWLDMTDAATGIELVDKHGIATYRAKSGHGNRPVIRVSWHGARAYAKWAGKELPTEAQWEYAARGGLVGKLYPSGDTIDATKANYGQNAGSTTDVGSYAANAYGLHDMAGNVWEWCLDTYDMDFYQRSPVNNPMSGDPETMMDDLRVLRGGSYLYSAQMARVANRDRGAPVSTGRDLGFRCVKPVSP